MLHLHFSNRLPELTRRLLCELALEPRGVFDRAEVLVPSRAVQRAVELAIADTHGICANLSFDNLARWLWRMVGRVLPELGGDSPFATESLTWQVLAVLEDRAFVSAHRRLEAYLAGSDEVMRYELAARIAALFDQYLTFRADWLERWARGDLTEPALEGTGLEDVRWQAALWQRLLTRLSAENRRPRTQFVAALNDPVKAALLPKAVHLIALPSIPPLYIEWLQGLSPYLQIHLYVLNPCREYWSQIVSPRQLARLQQADAAEGHEIGNPLLAAWGAPTAAYFASLIDAFGNALRDDEEAFIAAPAETLLAQLQNSILDLKDLPPGSLTLGADDRSLEVHVCHSLTRQLEVVVDRLLALFAERRDGHAPLRPSDVLIAVPDLDAAAPMIDAVFSALPESRRIPYTLTGRARSRSDGAARALCDWLALLSSRLEADASLALLSHPLIARRFGMDAERLDTLRRWVVASGYRWGLNAAHRAAAGLPAQSRNTLEDGLDRLFLAYALPAEQITPVLAEQLPAAGVRDPEAELLAAFDAYAGTLTRFVTATATPLTASAWAELLDEAIETLMAPEPYGSDFEELAQTRNAVRALCEAMQAADPSAVHALSVVRAALTAALDESARGGAASGAVTVAALSSLRGVPFRVICVLGLEDGVFPRLDRPADFDLIARAPRRGDRQRRADDRNVFLDHLTAAGEVLHLSYTGFSDRTNAPLPPSAVVSELLDTLLPATVGAELSGEARVQAEAAVRARLVIAHPLQPFATADFLDKGSGPRSFNSELAHALRLQLSASAADLLGLDGDQGNHNAEPEDEESEAEDRVTAPRRPFFTAPLPPAPRPTTLEIETVSRFFRNPAKALLERSLHIHLGRAAEDLPVRESLIPERDRDGALEERLYALARAGRDAEALRAYASASAEAAPGALGEAAIAQAVAAALEFARSVQRQQTGEVLAPYAAEVRLPVGTDTVTLTGRWADLRTTGSLRLSTYRASAGSLLAAWVEHVFLCCAPPAGMALVSRWLFRDELVTFTAPAEPLNVLQDLFTLYERGLCAPLPLYPKSSMALTEDGGTFKKARKKFEPPAYGDGQGESEAPALALALRGVKEPLDAEFERVSREVFTPLITCMRREPS